MLRPRVPPVRSSVRETRHELPHPRVVEGRRIGPPGQPRGPLRQLGRSADVALVVLAIDRVHELLHPEGASGRRPVSQHGSTLGVHQRQSQRLVPGDVRGLMWAWLWDFSRRETKASRASLRPIHRHGSGFLATMPPPAQNVDAFLEVAFSAGRQIASQRNQHLQRFPRLELQDAAAQRVAFDLATKTVSVVVQRRRSRDAVTPAPFNRTAWTALVQVQRARFSTKEGPSPLM